MSQMSCRLFVYSNILLPTCQKYPHNCRCKLNEKQWEHEPYEAEKEDFLLPEITIKINFY